MVPQARLLISARTDDMAGPLSEGMDQLGWRTITARGPYAAEAALQPTEDELWLSGAADDVPGAWRQVF